MIGRRLQVLRKTEGMTQDELGAKIGVSKQAISAWETGRNTPDNEMLIRIAEIYNVSVEYLLGTSDDQGKKPDRIPVDYILDNGEKILIETYRTCGNKDLFNRMIRAFSSLPDADRYILLGNAMKMSDSADSNS